MTRISVWLGAAVLLLAGSARAQEYFYGFQQSAYLQSVAVGELTQAPVAYELKRSTDGATLYNVQVSMRLLEGCAVFESGFSTFVAMTNFGGIVTLPRLRALAAADYCRVEMQVSGYQPSPIPAIRVFDPATVIVSSPNTIRLDIDTFQSIAFVPYVTSSSGVLADVRPTLTASSDPVTHATAASMDFFNAGVIGQDPALVMLTGNEFPGSYAITVSFRGKSLQIPVTQKAALPQRGEVYGSTATGERVSLMTSGSGRCGFAEGKFVDLSAVPVPPPANLSFPFGLVDFRLMCASDAQPAVAFQRDLGIVATTATFWVYGPTASQPAPHWHQIPMQGGSSRPEIGLRDGGDGDADLAVNGELKAIGGIAYPNGPYQDLWWSGVSENGWGLSIIQHRDVLFANLFVYDAQGKPTWFVVPGGTWNAAHTEFTGPLYQPRGAPFYGYDVSRHDIGPQRGTAKFAFNGESFARLEYSTSTAGFYSKFIERPAFGPYEDSPRPPRGDLWWGGVQQNGWGISILQQQGSLFLLWFTYDAQGAPTWFAMPSGAWTSSDTYEGRIYSTVGSSYLGNYRVQDYQATDVGSFRVRFSGESATFQYTVNGISGTMPLTRVPF